MATDDPEHTLNQVRAALDAQGLELHPVHTPKGWRYGVLDRARPGWLVAKFVKPQHAFATLGELARKLGVTP